MRRAPRGTTALLVSALALPAGLTAQETPELMTAVPESPAFTFLGTSPSLVERPGGLRDLGASLLSGVGADGLAQQGFALDATLWTLIPDFTVSLSDYQSSRWKFVLANSQFSVGTVRSAADSADTDAALGLRVTLMDHSDPMRDRAFTAALGDALLETCAPATPGAPASAACVDSVTEARWEEFSRQNWNKARLSLAAAAGARLVASQPSEREYNGFDAWAVGAIPVLEAGQLVGQVRYKDRPPLDTIAEYSAVSFGGRLLLGSPVWNGFLEYVQENRSGADAEAPELAAAGRVEAWSAGVEFRLTGETWVSTGFGQRFHALGDPEELVLLANIRWGLTSKTRFDALRATP